MRDMFLDILRRHCKTKYIKVSNHTIRIKIGTVKGTDIACFVDFLPVDKMNIGAYNSHIKIV